MAKRANECGEQTGINIFFSKKRNTGNIEETPSSSTPGQPNELMEQLIPIRQDIEALPNPMPKASSGHSVKKLGLKNFLGSKFHKTSSLFTVLVATRHIPIVD